MNPRLLLSLLPAIAAAAAGAIWCLVSGWGWLAALLVYSLGGSAVLILLAAVAAVLEARPKVGARQKAGRLGPLPAASANRG